MAARFRTLAINNLAVEHFQDQIRFQQRRREILIWIYLALPCIVPLGMEINKDLIAASSTPLVLAILAEGDSYGYAILKRVRKLPGGHLAWTDGMLNTVLHRLERLGFIEARWETADSGRRRKYYRLTSRGRTQLAEERRQWQVVDAALRGIWRMLSLSVPAAPLLRAA